MVSNLILVRNEFTFLQANCEDPDQTPLPVASALDLHYLPTSKNGTLDLYLFRYKLIFLQANSGDPNQTPLLNCPNYFYYSHFVSGQTV